MVFAASLLCSVAICALRVANQINVASGTAFALFPFVLLRRDARATVWTPRTCKAKRDREREWLRFFLFTNTLSLSRFACSPRPYACGLTRVHKVKRH